MRTDPRVDYIVRWRYAMVAENLRASAQEADPHRAQTLLMVADHYARLAAMPESGEARYLGLVADRPDDASCDPPSTPQLTSSYSGDAIGSLGVLRLRAGGIWSPKLHPGRTQDK